MKINYFFVAATIFIGGCAHTSDSVSRICGGDFSLKSNDRVTISNISIPQRSDEFVFYIFEKNYAVLMKPSDVLDFLREHNSFGEFTLLLEKITKDLPLKDNIDIKKYALEKAFLYSTAKRISADLIENGKASIVDMGYGENGEMLKDVSIVHLENGGNFRLICDSSRSLIFETTDSIAKK
jgi:hypothetical protein